MELGAVSFPLKVSVILQAWHENSVEQPGCTSKSSITPQNSHQNNSTNLTMSIVCIYVTDSVAFNTPEPLSLREESEPHDGDGIRRRRRWQRGNNGLTSGKLRGPVMTWKRHNGVVEPVRRRRNIDAQIWRWWCTYRVTAVQRTKLKGVLRVPIQRQEIKWAEVESGTKLSETKWSEW
jgi:hypothetical protein